MLNVGFGLIALGVVLFVATLITFGVVSFGSFGYAVKNMTDRSVDFDTKFENHGKAMGGMASGGLVLVIGGGISVLSIAGGIGTLIYAWAA